jgi:hypothetical protein
LLVIRFFAYLVTGLLLLAVFTAEALDPKQYDARLCSAELLVLQGDIRQLVLKSTPVQHQRGYQQRISGAMGTLRWLCRQYVFVYKLNMREIQGDIDNLYNAFNKQEWRDFSNSLNRLSEQMPLAIKNLKPDSVQHDTIKIGKEIYLGYCAACHNQPNLTQSRPAHSLFKMVRKLPRKEFIARMIVGVHGTAEIALQNPLSDKDIAGMTAYFLQKPELK